MVEGLVTVVLPVYGVEKYLNQCVESVVNQTYTRLEILLVDDGSPDNCPQICDAWARRDSRIRVIHKENAGLGMARNTGIDNATGEYICFFDSDDYIAPETVEKAYRLAVEKNAQAVVFGLVAMTPAGELGECFAPKVGAVTYEGAAVQEEFLAEFIAPDPRGDGTRNFYMSSCLILYAMEAVRAGDWHFVSEREIISEDVYSLLGFFAQVERVAVLPEALYYYRINTTSLSRSYRKDRYAQIKVFYSRSVALCKELGYSDRVCHRISKPYLAFTIGAMKQALTANLPKAECRAQVRAIIGDETLQRVLRQNRKDRVSLTRRVLYFAIRHKLYRFCYQLLQLRA